MKIIKQMDKKPVDTSLQINRNNPNPMSSALEVIEAISSTIVDTLEESAKVYDTVKSKNKDAIEILENLTEAIDDMIMRSPYALQTTPLLFDAYWLNKMAKYKIEKLKEWKKENNYLVEE